jgi:hypothetical protein
MSRYIVFPGYSPMMVYLISRRTKVKVPVRHYGILISMYGRALVFHFSDDSKVRPDTLEDFLDGYELLIHERRSKQPYEPVLEAMKFGYWAPLYSLGANNCEHFARWAFAGKAESHQVQAIGLLLSVGLLLKLAS